MADPLRLPVGFRAAAVACGVARGRPDLGLLLADEPARAAAVFTRNQLTGAHVSVCRENLAATGGRVRAVLVNAGNANCSTGREGIADNRSVCGALAETLGCASEEVLFLSTGVIGARLPVAKVLEALPGLVDATSGGALADFARAIRTTDTTSKLAGRAVGGAQVVGAAKGSGMIHPDMATMLGFLLTDVELPADPVRLLRDVCARTFHRCTVDGDTSPNDTVILWGSARHGSADLEHALTSVARDLSRAIARDGEGATRLVTVRVTGAPSEEDAVQVARTIATSPLTKTAVHGRDPNWGRILSAAGRAGVVFDPEAALVSIGPAVVFRDGRPRPEEEPAANRHMCDEDEVILAVDLHAGEGEAEVWTCDFSADYVRINADYRS